MPASSSRDCVFETPAPRRLQKRVHASVTNLRSQTKRRRLSAPATALELLRDENFDAPAETKRRSSATTDRFISNRPKLALPLNITPRTTRISKQFGLIDDRVLNFRDENTTLLPHSEDHSTMLLLRKSASTLFNNAPPIRPTSVMENLNKRRNCLMVLDSPGVPVDLESSPIAWSARNLIAVACGKSVFYQDLETKNVSRLYDAAVPGHLTVIRWGDTPAHRDHIATGMSTGELQVWDAGTQPGEGIPMHSWRPIHPGAVKSLAWNEHLLGVGMEDGEISLIDLRTPASPTELLKHKGHVLALEWSIDGGKLASADSNGLVCIWDRRNTAQPLAKLRHRGSTRALSWCPWKLDLLATGSSAPEGKIRIWNTSSLTPSSPEPAHTLPLNTSVFSLHWSPHCKELLSTHGPSFVPAPAPLRRAVSFSGVKTTLSAAELRPQPTYVQTSLTNAITVHEYPSGKRLMTLPNAHAGAITQSCLSPSGESVFTICPQEETIKMWQVWSKRPPAEKQESAFDRYTIR